MTPASLIGSARRVTVKVGSSLLVGQGQDRSQWLKSLAADLAELTGEGKAVIIVSSGAVALGRSRANLSKSRRLDAKQAAAAIGQPLLMQAWQSAFAESGKVTAQLLLTIGDTESRRRWRNARSTLDMLHRNGAIPIVNENDSVATEELRYGDNDRLSARIAQMAGADLLILLSDVDGLYEADPRRNPSAKHRDVVETIDEGLIASAGDAPAAGLGTGGMRTKLEAARIAQGFGCSTLIASGVGDHPIAALLSGQARATAIRAQGSPVNAYKAWIAGSLAPAGKLVVDEGAVSALLQGRSLLPSGCHQADGDFAQGSAVTVVDPNGAEVARGIIRYGAAEARAILGRKASEIPTILGYSRGDELIHRDDLVLS
jgi:glutamate 5-kinase